MAGTGEPGRLFVITGIMAVGKSTVAEHLAERFPKSVHLRGDQFRRAIVNGDEGMTPDPTDEALAQLYLRYELGVRAAERYVAAGFTTVLQDNFLGPALSDVVAMFEHDPIEVVALTASPSVIAQRERDRPKTGYHSFTPASLDARFRSTTPRIGLWLDTSEMTVRGTVDEILRRSPHETIVQRS